MAKPNPDAEGSDGPRVTAQLDQILRHPVVLQQQEKRAADLQLRIADRITAFAGSMRFVYIHVALFAIWMLFTEKVRGRPEFRRCVSGIVPGSVV
jgi:uncharacterized membrane protein